MIAPVAAAAAATTAAAAAAAGAEHSCYTADITRTFPASGTFTPQQRDIYTVVLDMQQHALDALKPGIAWADVQRSTRLLMLEQLQQLGLVVQGSVEGLLEAGVDMLFMPHGLGHFLGLDVHDVSDVGPIPQQLQEGQVITVEPGGCVLRSIAGCAAACILLQLPPVSE
jgi:Xaa-Pro dipeptidase